MTKGTKKKKTIVKTKPTAKMPKVEMPGGVDLPSGIDHNKIGL